MLVFSEDLARFPQESLHSFSFTQQSEESLHTRQNVLKRSMDFMKDKMAWGVNNPGLLDAQARVTGDHEMQGMVELLHKANLLAPESYSNTGLTGPITGPAVSGSENVFERNFAPIAESPKGEESKIEESLPPGPAEIDQNTLTQTDSPVAPDQAATGITFENLDRVRSNESVEQHPSQLLGRRSQLKRTFTDVAGYSLQDRLTKALAQPYMATGSKPVPNEDLVSPKQAPPSNEQIKRNMTIPPHHGSHGHNHGTRQNMAAQAIFTTDSKSPWTITAANDLACLIFGVTRAEVRKLGIMEVIRPERRRWLESKLRSDESNGKRSASDSRASKRSPETSPAPSPAAANGGGVTARLLSKPPARQTYQSRRSRTAENGIGPDAAKLSRANSTGNKSRGVLLCGDVVPIQKRNGALGSASLWVKEKQGGLIWVLEEIAEDEAFLALDEVGCVTKGTGALQAIFGIERVRRGMDVKKLLPELPKQTGTHTGALDWDEISSIRRYTARTTNNINIPVTVDLMPDEPAIRVSSFPHIAGIMVLSAQSLKVTSSNSVFAGALFGHEHPEGLHITELIPLFDDLLALISDEDQIDLRDGIVIPEHSFRRARALLAVKDGRADAASIFLRPSGLPAKHRDGSEIMVDVQMRVVKSESQTLTKGDIIAEEEDGDQFDPRSDVSFALWITYSRQLHAVNHGVGPVPPYISPRPGTPPHLPEPGQADIQISSSPATPLVEDKQLGQPILPEDLQRQLREASDSPMIPASASDPELYEHPSPAATAAGVNVTKKKLIADFVILEEMGKGAYGEVKLVRYRKPNAQKMVVKYVTKRRILVDTWTRDRRLGTVPLEIHVLDYLRRDGLLHPNVIEMADFFEDDTNYYIEMLPHGLPGVDLFDYIELRVNMDERECRQIFIQVAAALHHLHVTAKVVHRDIKDENVVLDGEGRVKLIDFGSAAYIKSGPFDVFVGTIGK